MGIFELAKELGIAIKNDPLFVRFEKAKADYEADSELNKYIVEYDVQQKALQSEVAKEDKDTRLIEVIEERASFLYRTIMENERFIELNEAQTAVNDLMNRVNSTITFYITGEVPSSGCASSGGCAGCSGCGH